MGKMNKLQSPMQLRLRCISGMNFGKDENLIQSMLVELKLVLLVVKAKCSWNKEPIIKN